MENNYVYILSYMGEYKLKSARLVIDFDALEEFHRDVEKMFRVKTTKILKLNENEFISKLYIIAGNHKTLKKIAEENSEYILALLDAPYGIGADDGHFDYFPDLVDQFRQLCKFILENDLYNKTIDKIKAHDEYKDSEVVFKRL